MSDASRGLHVEWTGAGRRVVFLHGFTQTGRSWETIVGSLGEGVLAGLVDLPGHGGSSTVSAGLDDAADLIAGVAGRSVFVGYSLGGRHALHLALRHPESVAGLVLLGATAGIEDPDERTARQRNDELLADRIEAIGVAAFLDEWLALPLFAGLPRSEQALADRLRNTPSGLASSLCSAGTGTQTPSWHRLAELGAAGFPVLVAAGELDTKFVGLGRRLAAEIGPTASFVEVAGAGHSAHLEQPEAFSELLSGFLDRCG